MGLGKELMHYAYDSSYIDIKVCVHVCITAALSGAPFGCCRQQ